MLFSENQHALILWEGLSGFGPDNLDQIFRPLQVVLPLRIRDSERKGLGQFDHLPIIRFVGFFYRLLDARPFSQVASMTGSHNIVPTGSPASTFGDHVIDG